VDGIGKTIIKQIEKYINNGMTTVDALESVGAKQMTDTNVYFITYDLYQDKALFFKVT
jgi:hypothetical protein